MEITLPWPPSLNHYYRHVGPKVLISKEGRQYRRKVAKQLGNYENLTMYECPIELSMELYPPDNRKRDVDNSLKSCLDAVGTTDSDTAIAADSVRFHTAIARMSAVADPLLAKPALSKPIVSADAANVGSEYNLRELKKMTTSDENDSSNTAGEASSITVDCVDMAADTVGTTGGQYDR
jgi:Holliday junction resolvase RusA-like endonuclease